MTSFGLSSTSDIITFDQNWHHLYSTSAGGKGLFNDAQIRVIGLVEPEICKKILKKIVKNSEQNFLPLHLRSLLTTSKPNRRSITAAKRKEKKKKEREKKIPKIKKPKDDLKILISTSQNAIKRDSSDKKG